MRNSIGKLIICVVITMIVFAPWSTCNAQSNRSNKTEFSSSFLFLGGESVDVSSNLGTIEEDDWTMYGLYYGVNTSEHLNINTELVFGSIDVEGKNMPEGYEASGDQDTWIWLINVEYNILAEPMTPYLTGGLGYGYSSGDFEVCTPTTTVSGDIDTTGFAYTVGVGGRWDISDSWFAKIAYRIIWDDAGDDRSGFGLSVGFMY